MGTHEKVYYFCLFCENEINCRHNRNYDYDDDNKNATFQCKYYSSFLCVAVD